MTREQKETDEYLVSLRGMINATEGKRVAHQGHADIYAAQITGMGEARDAYIDTVDRNAAPVAPAEG